MQIGNLNNFGYDRMKMDHDLPYTDWEPHCNQLTEPNLLTLKKRAFTYFPL